MPSALLAITYQIRHCEWLQWLSCQQSETTQCALQWQRGHYLSAKLITCRGCKGAFSTSVLLALCRTTSQLCCGKGQRYKGPCKALKKEDIITPCARLYQQDHNIMETGDILKSSNICLSFRNSFNLLWLHGLSGFLCSFLDNLTFNVMDLFSDPRPLLVSAARWLDLDCVSIFLLARLPLLLSLLNLAVSWSKLPCKSIHVYCFKGLCQSSSHSLSFILSFMAGLVVLM